MSRVADLLEGWSKDPAYAHDFAALARELEARCTAEASVDRQVRTPGGRAKPERGTATPKTRLKAKGA